MALSCRGCGNSAAYRVQARMIENKIIDICDRCGDVGSAHVPDVYWPGHAYKSENITDANGNPILLTSRRHKAEVMREQGLSEAGDKYHGSRVETLKHMVPEHKVDAKAEVRAALQQAAQQLRRKYYT